MPDFAQLDELKRKQQELQSKVIAMTPQFKETQNGGIKTTSVVNAQLAINYDPLLEGLLAYNDFTWEVEVMRDVPEIYIKKGQMLDAYTSLILVELEKLWDVTFSDKTLEHAVIATSRKATYNPVQDYLNEAEKEWDGKQRMFSLLENYLGVEQTEATHLIIMLWFTGAVAKAFQPDVKFDYVLDLVGGQGAGKTTFLEKMSAGWYTDQFTSFIDKDSFGTMLRSWIVNDDEMTVTAASSFEELKKFISARKLEFRPAYGRTTVRRDKSFVIARTTNEQTYLKDKTGERRFLPLQVDKSRQTKHPVPDLDEVTVKQFWGEVVRLYHNGFNFELTHDQELMLSKHREEFMYIDAIEESVENVLATWSNDFITSKEIGNNIGASDLIKSKSVAKKIKYIMDNRSDWKAGAKKVKGISKRGWHKL